MAASRWAQLVACGFKMALRCGSKMTAVMSGRFKMASRCGSKMAARPDHAEDGRDKLQRQMALLLAGLGDHFIPGPATEKENK